MIQPQRTLAGWGQFLKLAVVPLAVAAAGCATGSGKSYAGISLEPGGADPMIQYLAAAAKAGNKLAQLELGVTFEEGRRLPRDCKRAQKLYRLAAAATGGTIYSYQPPVRKGGRGMVVPINMGPRVAGLPEARQRLSKLDLSSDRCAQVPQTASISKQD